MTSPEQIAANRRNAALSTGPRTPAGKAASRLNASRHGLLARELLVKGESKANFAAFADGVRARLAPDGELEIFVVNRVISAAWRLRRALTAESALFCCRATKSRSSAAWIRRWCAWTICVACGSRTIPRIVWRNTPH